jgi:hypothetical protein
VSRGATAQLAPAYVGAMEGSAALLDQTPVTPAYVQARTSDGRAEVGAVLQRAEQLLAHLRFVEAIAVLGEGST